MPKLSSKHANQKYLTLSDFSGGLNILYPPESIDDNQLKIAENWEISQLNGSLQTISGFSLLFQTSKTNIVSIYAVTDYAIYFATATEICYIDLLGETTLGTLTGTKTPIFVKFGDDILIASGGKLQKVTNQVLTTISSSPDSDLVFVRNGRVIVANSNSDYLYYSATGNASGWTDDPNDDSTSKSVQIGYKDGGKIITVVPLSSDLLIFKDNNKVFRIIGEYSSWVVKEVSRNANCCGVKGAVQAENSAYFAGNRGFMSLDAVIEYSDVAMSEPGSLINGSLQGEILDTSRVWYLPTIKQIWISTTDNKKLYIYHLGTKSFTSRLMTTRIGDVTYYGKKIYISREGKILTLVDAKSMDESENIKCYLTSKTFNYDNKVLIKKIVIQTYNNFTGSATITISDGTKRISLPISLEAKGDIAYLDDDVAFSDEDMAYFKQYTESTLNCNVYMDTITVDIAVVSGSFSIKKIQALLAEVG